MGYARGPQPCSISGVNTPSDVSPLPCEGRSYRAPNVSLIRRLSQTVQCQVTRSPSPVTLAPGFLAGCPPSRRSPQPAALGDTSVQRLISMRHWLCSLHARSCPPSANANALPLSPQSGLFTFAGLSPALTQHEAPLSYNLPACLGLEAVQHV